MNPRLIVISGKLKGTVFALNETEVNIGREAANVIRLNESSVSRQHCLIKQEDDGRFFIHDLESFNGVFVNGTPIKNQEIKHGDQIGIGDVIMFFLSQEAESEALLDEEKLAIFQDSELNDQSTIRLTRKDAVYLSPENLLAELPQIARVTRDLSVLLQITSVLNSAHELDSLQRHLLKLTLEAIPAERGAILLVDEHELEIASHVVLNIDPEAGKNIQVSKTVIEQCLKEQVSILCNNVGEDEEFHLAESLTLSGTKSILCVPLTLSEKIVGIIYLDTSNLATVFDQNHLQLLTGIGEIAARPLENVRHIESLKLENQRLLTQIMNDNKIIGESEQMKNIFSLITRIAPTESTVLIIGESGTGKELAAHSIHQHSHRQNRPFIAMNCATLTENLLESELFGFERGAFTGAVAPKMGQFEIADGGTVFLDEIGELAINLQAKLLRVLQEREIIRLGGTKPKNIDVRVIAATNRNLQKAILNGTFREDLYYRLNVINLKMPSLREHPEDIPLLTRFFINKYNHKCKRNVRGVSPEAKLCLQNHEWAGNVRELENTIERAIILAQEDIITLDDLPETILNQLDSQFNPENPGKEVSSFREAVFNAKKKIIQDAITGSNGNITEAAKKLAVHPNNLHRLIREFGLRG